MSTTLYRYEASYATQRPELLAVTVTRETPKCFFFRRPGKGETRVLKSQEGKRYAYLSRDDALVSYHRRCLRRIWHLERQLHETRQRITHLGLEQPEPFNPNSYYSEDY